jgi:hypothetical protein
LSLTEPGLGQGVDFTAITFFTVPYIKLRTDGFAWYIEQMFMDGSHIYDTVGVEDDEGRGMMAIKIHKND